MNLYKRMSVILTMGIMGIGLISFSTAYGKTPDAAGDVPETTVAAESGENTGIRTSKSGSDNAYPEPTPIPSPTPTPGSNYLTLNSNTKIRKLIKDYLDAKLTCSKEAFEDIVTDTGYIDVDTLVIQTETVLSYDLLDCYTKRGYGPIDYVVYYTYNMNIATLTSPVLALDSLYVKVDDDGNYRVFLGRIDDDVQAYLESLNNDDDVKAVISRISESINAAMDEDETVMQYWQRMYQKLKDYFDSQNQDDAGSEEQE